MVYFFRLVFLAIRIDQETVLKWFGIEDPAKRDFRKAVQNGLELNISDLAPSPDVSQETFRLIIEGLSEKIQNGLTLGDIESILFFILFIRFVILAIRYNIKTSFYIICIGLFAGYLWYRHLTDIVTTYRHILLRIPFLHKLGMNAIELHSLNRTAFMTDFRAGEKVHWYNPARLLYYGFAKGILHIEPDSGFRYYIDPISMIVSNLPEPAQAKIFPIYYQVYNKIIPRIFTICTQFWTQLSGVVAYAVITRIGKRYCPYLVRWHWTFLLVMAIVEQLITNLISRIYYFQTFVLIPKVNEYVENEYGSQYQFDTLVFQINFLNAVIAAIVVVHISFITFGMLHAISGQYFYLPFFVENTELHIGPRPKNSVYSGGQTAWQDPEEKEKNLKRVFPKLWYGWFGRGNNRQFRAKLIRFLNKMIKKLKKRFRQFRRR